MDHLPKHEVQKIDSAKSVDNLQKKVTKLQTSNIGNGGV